MIKQIIIYILLFFSLLSYGQEELAHFKVSMKKSAPLTKDIVPIVNKTTGNISFSLISSKSIFNYLFNDHFKIIDSLQMENKSIKYKSIIGHSINSENECRIYLTSDFEDKFSIVNFSYKKDTSYIKDFELNFKDEVFVQAFPYNQHLYILSIIKKSSIINVYELNKDGTIDKKSVDFSKTTFLNYKNKETTLYELLLPNNSALKGGPIISNSKKIADVVKIDTKILNPIDITAGLSKLYLYKNKVLLTLDQNEQLTQLISINLNTFQKGVFQIKKPFYEIEKNKKKTNSFICNDKIFMIATTKDKFTFMVKNLLNQNKIVEYSASETDSINFKNSPIIQVGGYYDTYQEFEKTKKFLRKIYDGDDGMSVYKTKNTYEILLGGKAEYKASGGGMGLGGPSISTTSFGAVTVYYNPTLFAYNQYAHTKSTFVKGFFDKDFKHIEGNIPTNAYDKIKSIKEDKEISPNAKTVFKYKDFYILGNYFLWPRQEYVLYKFED